MHKKLGEGIAVVVEKKPHSDEVALEKKKVSLSTLVFAVVVTAVAFFIFGTRSYLLPAPFSRSTAPSQLDYSSLNALYAKLREKYDGEIDPDKLIDGAKHGMIDAVGDPYTVYLNDEEAKQFSDDMNGTFEGIGAELGKVNGQLTIMSVIAGSPAQKVGLQNRDVIMKVNDEDTANLTVGAAVEKIRGAKGTSVKLTIFRDSSTKDYSVTRDTITSQSVESEVLEGNIGYMRILRFGDDTSSLATKAAEDFKAKGVQKIILDLRGNGGGLLMSSKEVASLWLDDKVIVSERTGGTTTETLRSGRKPVLGGLKTVVLVDGGSASASEIVAGALKDNGAATLVGEKTFGKGSVQLIEDVLSGGKLKVTVAKWYTPNGTNINKEGIKPDKEVKHTEEDTKNNRDPQKDAAIEALK